MAGVSFCQTTCKKVGKKWAEIPGKWSEIGGKWAEIPVLRFLCLGGELQVKIDGSTGQSNLTRSVVAVSSFKRSLCPMDSKFPSRAWSCQTIQKGLDLARDMSLDLGACDEPDLAAMELELAQLQVAGERIPDFLPSP